MPNKAALLLPLLLLAACGESESKAAFERYESAVDPLLEKEEKLRARFEDKVQDMIYPGKQKEVDDLIRDALVPFYREMAKSVAAVTPEGDALESIHADLVRYVELRNELFRVYVDLDSKAKETKRKEDPANEKVDQARGALGAKVQAILKDFEELPGVKEKVLPVFLESDQVTNQIVGGVERLRQGALAAAVLLEYIDQRAVPFLDELEKKIDALDLPGKAEGFRKNMKAYAAALRDLVGAARELALVRQTQEGELEPLEQRFSELQEDVGTALAEYLEGAKEYRASLK